MYTKDLVYFAEGSKLRKLLKYFLQSLTVLLIPGAPTYPHTRYSTSGLQSRGLFVKNSVNIKLPSVYANRYTTGLVSGSHILQYVHTALCNIFYVKLVGCVKQIFKIQTSLSLLSLKACNYVITTDEYTTS
jgi:hypothetical protein